MKSQKSRHACHLFNEMSKFQKCGILCDITINGKLCLKAHRVVLKSAQLSEASHVITPTSPDIEEEGVKIIDTADVLWINEAYSSGENESSREESNSDAASRHDSPETRLTTLDSFRRHHCFCDVTLETNVYTCDVHKVVLAASSDYFRAMFTCNMKEHDMSRVLLRGVDGAYVKRIVDYIYSGELPFQDWQDGLELLKMAVFYQIPSMIHLCTSKLLSSIDAPAACAFVQQGRELALKTLSKQSIEFLHDHFLELDTSDAPIELLHPDDLINLLQSECLGRNLHFGTESSVLRIVQRWLLMKQPVSPEIEDQILSHVRFSLVPSRDILMTCKQTLSECNKLSQDDLSFSSIFRAHLLKALKYHNAPHSQPLHSWASAGIRSKKSSWLSVDGVMTSTPVKVFTGSKFLSNENVGENDTPIRDPFHSVVVLNGFVFVLGGTRKVDEGYSREVLRYDPRLDKWIKVAPMLEARGDFVAVTFGNFIFVMGGRNQHGALNTCECYNPIKNAWWQVASLPESVYMAAGIKAEEKIYVTGGFNNYETVGSTSCYNPATDTWEQIYSPMMSERGYHVIAKGCDDRLWVIGGVDNPFSGRNVWEVEAFDLKTKMWFYVGQILPVKPLLSAVRLNVNFTDEGHICISAVTYPDKHSVLTYDPNQKMWLELKEKFECVRMDAPE